MPPFTNATALRIIDAMAIVFSQAMQQARVRLASAASPVRRLCPEPEFGTHTIARHLVRSGVQVSRSTEQCVLREIKPKPQRRPRGLVQATGAEPHGLLTPDEPNVVWHLDLACLRILWFRYTVTALLDGCSRKLLRLRVFKGAPDSNAMIKLVQSAVGEYGHPRFLITDHGCQFRRRFRQALERLGTDHACGRRRCPAFNGKVERFFRTFRLWERKTLLPLSLDAIQQRLDGFRGWYNAARPHAAQAGRTPDEAWVDHALPEPIPFRAADQRDVLIDIRREAARGDLRLPSVRIRLAA